MRVAALYDVHGMPHALEAVLAEVARERPDAIVFGGDLLEGPLPRETLELVRGVDATFVRGNCEREPSEHVRGLLDEETLAWARSWRETVGLDGVLYCHSAPRSDSLILTERSPQERFDEALAGVDARLVVGGHTHHQFRRGAYVNAGSVGMPYEDDVAAFWALVDDGEVAFRRTEFDVDRAAAEVEASGWPAAREFVPENLRAAPSRDEAIDYFESRA